MRVMKPPLRTTSSAMFKHVILLLSCMVLAHACTQGLLDRTPPGDTLATGSLLRHAILTAGGGAINFAEKHMQQKNKRRRQKCHEYQVLQTVISDEPLVAEEASPFLRFFGFGGDEEDTSTEQTEDDTDNHDNNTQTPSQEEQAQQGDDDTQAGVLDAQEQQDTDIVIEETVSEAVSRQVETYLEAEQAIIEESVNSWKELWVIRACGVVTQVELRFIADGKGETLVHIPFEAIALYTPP
ncbi:MAG: hypothetical protein GDA54_04385 [Alphaproteobacteria bacterium GM7ARS4]|nr:hypothetical protein [Alphaproteobacteria bacterium GM7ARS4]